MPTKNVKTLAVPDAAFTAALHDRFAEALGQTGPFEPCPRLALGVSGGGDSLAMALLADRWAKAQGARLAILTVDHGLRPAAADEAAGVAALAQSLGHSAAVLTWEGAKPTVGLAAAARSARYRLLGEWCRHHQVLHLLIAHTADDQAETLLMRLERGSGGGGLSAMAAVTPLDGVRLLRPLLGERRVDLARLVDLAGLTAVDDPSNHDDRRARPRLRRLIGDLGLDVPRLAATAAALAREAAVVEQVVGDLAVLAVTVTPFGEAQINRPALRIADCVVVEKLMAAVLAVVGGGDYQPRQERLARLVRLLRDEAGPLAAVTLGGCRIWSQPKAPDLIWVVREAAAISPPLVLAPGDTGLWDGRYAIMARRPLTVAPLGGAQTGLMEQGMTDWPAARRAVLPAGFGEGQCLGVLMPGDGPWAQVEFRPRRPLYPRRFGS